MKIMSTRIKGLSCRVCMLVMTFFVVFLGETAWAQTPTPTPITSLSSVSDPNGSYIITQDISGGTAGVSTFSGTLTAQADENGIFPVISGLTQPLFITVTGAKISNIMLKEV